MRRKLFMVLSALSLLLCIATAVLWVRSRSMGELVRWYVPPRLTEAHAHDGVFYIFSSRRPRTRRTGVPLEPGWKHDRTFYDDLGYGSGRILDLRFWRDGDSWLVVLPSLGFGLWWEPDLWEVKLPFWFAFLCFAAVPTVSLTGVVLRRRRTRLGCCTSCGYDLRASPDRCPECGMAVPRPPPSPSPGAATT